MGATRAARLQETVDGRGLERHAGEAVLGGGAQAAIDLELADGGLRQAGHRGGRARHAGDVLQVGQDGQRGGVHVVAEEHHHRQRADRLATAARLIHKLAKICTQRRTFCR